MDNRKLFSIAALFKTPDEIIHAADEVYKSGYRNYDVNTPYPIHGMDDAMRLKPSKLGYVALVVGLSAVAAALYFMWWVSYVDYPLVIGGKPYFSLPALIPVTFEVTVLSASIATVAAMLFIFFKLPNNSHPIHDTEYMKRVSSDRYGINIQANDENFDEDKVTQLLSSLHAEKITPIYYEDGYDEKPKIFEPKFIYFLIAVALANAGMVYFAFNKVLFWAPFSWMSDQNKVVPQDRSMIYSDGFAMRMPVEGTVARGHMPYMYETHAEAAAFLANPLLPSKENLETGGKKYNTFCSPCHDYYGQGNSRLRGQFPNPPSLHSNKVRNWTDGDLYHVITKGQNTMPSYASQVSPQERWQIILYIRALQRSQNAKETDL